MQSIEELEGNLSTYEEQLQQVRELYEAEPDNGEYAEMVKELEEVLEQTRELLATAKQSDLEAPTSTVQSPNHSKPENDRVLATILPDGYETHDVPGRLPIGTRVQAVWSEDGEWYGATIEAITPNGYFVAYDEWGNKEEVDLGNVKVISSGEDENEPSGDDALLDAEKEAEATKQALKRKIAQAADIDVMPRDLPAKLRIRPEDPEDLVRSNGYGTFVISSFRRERYPHDIEGIALMVDRRRGLSLDTSSYGLGQKIAKRKKIHAFKSKQRLEQMELTQNKRQNAWQQFQTAKGKSKKQVGFFTGRKKESIFKSPDDPKGKVGVTGSGKGITEFHKREKHLHMRVGAEDGEEWQ